MRCRAFAGWSVVLSVAALAVVGPSNGLLGQANHIALRIARLGEDGSTHTFTGLQVDGRAAGSILGLPIHASGSAWLDLGDLSSSLVNVEQLIVTKEWDSAEIRVGLGDVRWGISEVRSPIDVLTPRALLWNTWDGPRMGRPLVGLTLFGGGGALEAVAVPLSRPVHLGQRRWTTWSGRHIRSSQAWDDRFTFGLRVTRTTGPIDLAISYVDGQDRTLGTREVSAFEAEVEHPRIRQLGFELEWALGNSVSLRSEGAIPTGGAAGRGRLLGGVEWNPTPYLSLLLEHSISGWRREARTPLENDLMIGIRLLSEHLRLRGRLFVDPRSGNRHYSVAARWIVGELTSLEASLAGVSGDPRREPPLAVRQPAAIVLSVVRYF